MASNPQIGPVTLILGGARSGKSAFGLALVEGATEEPVVIATARASDPEMAARIERHRAGRGAHWRTIEEETDLVAAVRREAGPGRAVLVDCLTLWLANLMEDGRDPEQEIEGLVQGLGNLAAPVVLISNEVGHGIVPANPLARAFRDHAGRMNQAVAAAATSVFLVTAGLAQPLK